MSVEHYENFPVASVLCPPSIRPAVVAIYHFARTADDIADEGNATVAERLADLNAFRSELVAAVNGTAPGARWRPVFAALGETMRRHGLPAQPLHDLLDAFTQDVHNPPYPDRAALLDYCRRSANPVGRLLLHLYREADPQALRQSDAICSALQLANFWQDLSVDLPRGRCYLPQDAQRAHGLDAGSPPAGGDSPATRALVHDLVDWSRSLMLEGAPLVRRLPGRAGWELRLVVQGGLRILEKIERGGHAAMSHRPKIGAGDAPLLLWRAIAMREARA